MTLDAGSETPAEVLVVTAVELVGWTTGDDAPPELAVVPDVEVVVLV